MWFSSSCALRREPEFTVLFAVLSKRGLTVRLTLASIDYQVGWELHLQRSCQGLFVPLLLPTLVSGLHLLTSFQFIRVIVLCSWKNSSWTEKTWCTINFRQRFCEWYTHWTGYDLGNLWSTNGILAACTDQPSSTESIPEICTHHVGSVWSSMKSVSETSINICPEQMNCVVY